MSVLIKSLTSSAPPADTSLAAQLDSFNTLQTANTVYDLYAAPNDSVAKRAAILKSIRLVNKHATAIVKVTLWFNRPNANGQNRRLLLTPADMPLLPNFVYIDDSEITLDPGDKIQCKADTGGVVQYLISGLERDA